MYKVFQGYRLFMVRKFLLNLKPTPYYTNFSIIFEWKIDNMKKYLKALLFAPLFALLSCGNNTANSHADTADSTVVNSDTTTYSSRLRPHEKLQLGKVYTDTVIFDNVDEHGDYTWVAVRKGKDTVGLVVYEEPVPFVKGEEIELKWKVDSIRYAGDAEYLEHVEYFVAAKRLKPLKLTDKKVKILGRETRYDEELKTDFNAIVLNQKFLRTISDPEKAALAYVATFIGNECEWDGPATDDRSNLKCKLLTALDLGYQCSSQHLEFLQNWFRSNKEILKELQGCPTIPDGATFQNTFETIDLEVKNNRITVTFNVQAINVREGKSWTWTEKNVFDFKENELILIKKDKTPSVEHTFSVEGR